MHVIVFAGTTEGRETALYLAEKGVRVTACVATEYGNMVMPEKNNIQVRTGRLNEEQITDLIKEYSFVIDATHPYADIVTENIRRACYKVKKEYLRLNRSSISVENVITVANTREAVNYLNTVEGNVLLTTGSKELEAYTAVRDYENRLYARVLPTVEVVEKCTSLGFKGKNLICMQGPFSYELNTAMLRQFNVKYLVTKDTGATGGFDEKVSAARETGSTIVMISRPTEIKGYSFNQLKEYMDQLLFSAETEIDKNSKSMDGNHLTYQAENMIDNMCVRKRDIRFPLFVPLDGRRILVVGGGRIATRRVKTLLNFRAEIYVVSEGFSSELLELSEQEKVFIKKGGYCSRDMEGSYLVIAATDNREINHLVYIDALKRNIPISVADKKEECSFYFPAVFETSGIVGGVVSVDGGDHRKAKRIAEKLRGLEF